MLLARYTKRNRPYSALYCVLSENDGRVNLAD